MRLDIGNITVLMPRYRLKTALLSYRSRIFLFVLDK